MLPARKGVRAPSRGGDEVWLVTNRAGKEGCLEEILSFGGGGRIRGEILLTGLRGRKVAAARRLALYASGGERGRVCSQWGGEERKPYFVWKGTSTLFV